jgi:rhamnose utilization protein RhaD (predicted bifunctional aldolase and dehydrogenase)
VILGGHGITAWGATSEECERNSLDIIATAERFLAERGKPEPFGAELQGYRPLPPDERRVRAAALAPLIRGLVSTDRPQLGHFTDCTEVLDFLSSERHPQLAALGTSCPDHFLRTKVRPLVLDLRRLPTRRGGRPAARPARQYREDYRAYYERYADDTTPAMRGADPAIVLVPASGCSASAPTSRPPAWRASST